MSQIQIPCTEVVPKSALKNASQSLIFSAITMTDAIWKPGDKGTITITFGGYGCDGCSPDAAWSQIGNHSNDNYPSMNLGFIDPPYTSFMFNGKSYTAPASATRNYCGTTGPGSCTSGWVPGATVIHEFGHALGMLHEHQNNLENASPIELNKPQVVAYYNCIGMGESGAVTNVLDTYMCKAGETCNYAGTKFDPKSIMLYYLPSAWIQGCTPYSNLNDCNGLLAAFQKCSKNPTKPNFVLSSEDIGWLQQQYPLNSTDPPEITVKFIDQNPEPWKVAWVQKMITETYGKLLGIKWIFDTDRILGSPTSAPGPIDPNVANFIKYLSNDSNNINKFMNTLWYTTPEQTLQLGLNNSQLAEVRDSMYKWSVDNTYVLHSNWRSGAILFFFILLIIILIIVAATSGSGSGKVDGSSFGKSLFGRRLF